jgi:hypothetical protein
LVGWLKVGCIANLKKYVHYREVVVKVGWLAVFGVFLADCVFSRFSRSEPPTNQPANLQHQTACSAKDVKGGWHRQPCDNSQPSGDGASTSAAA